MEALSQHQLQCPVCRLQVPDTEGQCPRCRADLTALTLLARTARTWLAEGREAIRSAADYNEAREHLRAKLEFVMALDPQRREEAAMLLEAVAREVEEESEVGSKRKQEVKRCAEVAEVQASGARSKLRSQRILARWPLIWTRPLVGMVLGLVLGLGLAQLFWSQTPHMVDVGEVPAADEVLPSGYDLVPPPESGTVSRSEPEPGPSELVPAASPPPDIYVVVREGDSLWSLSRAVSGSGALYPLLSQANGLTSSVIYPGQLLRVPPEWVNRLVE